MKEKECKLVQDLLPNYIEKLTSKESNKIIETHLKECPECKRILEDMQYDIGLKSKEQCQKETKYMKKYRNKLKILKFLGLILLIIVLAFVVNTIRKYIILNDLYNKSQTINIETKDNYHAILTASRQNSVYYIEQYRKGNKAIQYENSYIKDGNKIKISNKTHYNSNTENFSLISDGINKEKVKGSEDIQNLEWQDLSELKINSLYSAIYSKVKKINYEKRDCYLIQDFGQEIVVEANTGNIIRMVSSLPEEQTTTFEYFREFDTVQDSDIIRTETTDYMEK